MVVERQEARCPAVVDVVHSTLPLNRLLLNTVTFDPFTLPSLPVDRHVMSSTVNIKKNNNVSYPLNVVVVNIHLLLVLLASSKGNRLDYKCAKNNKEREEEAAFDSCILCLSR